MSSPASFDNSRSRTRTGLRAGPASNSLSEVVTILTGGEAERDAWRVIVLDPRLSKALTAVFAGAALSVSGVPEL